MAALSFWILQCEGFVASGLGCLCVACMVSSHFSNNGKLDPGFQPHSLLKLASHPFLCMRVVLIQTSLLPSLFVVSAALNAALVLRTTLGKRLARSFERVA